MNTICPFHTPGKHILLLCPSTGATYATKNIDYIGARSIFPVKGGFRDGEPCDINELVHECSKEINWSDIDQRLAMFRRQGRSLYDVKSILRDTHGEDLGKKLLKRYKEIFQPMSEEKANLVERMLYGHNEGFSSDPEIAKQQARQIVENIAKEILKEEGIQ